MRVARLLIQRPGQLAVPRQQRRELEVGEAAVPDPHPAIDHVQGGGARLAEHQRGDRIMAGARMPDPAQVEGHDVDDIKTLHTVLDQTDLTKLTSLK